MEEQVGALWHRLITRATATAHPHAAVTLGEVSKTVGVVFRALGGDAGLRVTAATATAHGARRGWLQRIAGGHGRVSLCWRDGETLRLPACIDLFPDRALNRSLYLWLAALAACDMDPSQPWFTRNQALTRHTLARFPGLRARYRDLVQAQLGLRPDPGALPPAEAARERAIRQALQHPGSMLDLPPAKRSPQPVYLWLHPAPPLQPDAETTPDDELDSTGSSSESRSPNKSQRRPGKRTDQPDGKRGLLAFRLESLFTRAEHVHVDRCSDDEEDLASAEDALDDLDLISVVRDHRPAARSLRFDLDLPAPAYDDTPLGSGILLPEWDYTQRRLQWDHCRIQPLLAADAAPIDLPPHLKRLGRRLRQQFAALAPARRWLRGQPEGSDVDLDAYLQHVADRKHGRVNSEQGMYRDFRGGSRDLACLLLADLSLSTDAWISNRARVIDVIRDSLFLFAEALSATGDAFGMYGFSSRRRDPIRFHVLKAFGQRYSDRVRGRIHAIKPGFYTRMGAAIRYASTLLGQQRSAQRLLLLLTDGKPNDLDRYEGRYGVEDTRMALHEARKQGLQPFCVTIDETAGDYLPYLFGTNAYVVIRKPSELPKQLPLLYARLTH